MHTGYSPSGREVKAGSQAGTWQVETEAEIMKERCCLYWLASLTYSATFLVQPRDCTTQINQQNKQIKKPHRQI